MNPVILQGNTVLARNLKRLHGQVGGSLIQIKDSELFCEYGCGQV
jgi:hypothetical protein